MDTPRIKMDEKLARYLEKSLLGGLAWPVDGDGHPEDAALLGDYPDRAVFENTMMSLRLYGIPAFEQGTAQLPFTKVLFGTSLHGAAVFVPQSMREDALYLLLNPPEESETEA